MNEDKSRGISPATQHEEAATPRRDFLSVATLGLAGLCGLGVAVLTGRAAMPEIDDAGPRRFPVGNLSDFKINTATALKDRGLFIVRGEAGIAALSARCTHLGCIVRRVETGFACPCHGAQFGHRGEILTGPQRRPLPWYAATLNDEGSVIVDLDQEVAPLDALDSAGGDPP